MITVINAISHFLVDAACVCALFSFEKGLDVLSAAVMLYNTLAFSTQCVVGLAFDSFIGNRRSGRSEAETVRIHGYFEAVSMIVVAVGALIPCGVFTKAVIVGLGNSLFHVTGGIVTLKRSCGKAAPLGVFVAPGAFGVTLGKLCPSALTWVAAVLIAAAVCCFAIYSRGYRRALEAGDMITEKQKVSSGGEREHMAGVSDNKSSGLLSSGGLLPIVLLTAAVAVRAIGGCAAEFTWNDSAFDAVLLTLFVFLGKALGGFVCDRIGAARMSAVTIVLAAVLTAFCAFSMPLSLIGQFLLNLSMPVTLWLLYRRLPDYPGLAFGIAASALWPGTIAGWLIQLTGPLQSVLIIICFIFGLGAIIYAEKTRKII